MKKHSAFNKIFATSILMLSMLFSLVPSSVILAEEAEDVPWQPLPCYTDRFVTISGEYYNGVAAGENQGTDDAMTRTLEDGTVQFCIKNVSEIVFKKSTGGRVTFKGELSVGDSKTPLYTIFELKNQKLYLTQGAITSTKFELNAIADNRDYVITHSAGEGMVHITMIKDNFFNLVCDDDSKIRVTDADTGTTYTGSVSRCFLPYRESDDGTYWTWNFDRDKRADAVKGTINNRKYFIKAKQNISPEIIAYAETKLDGIAATAEYIYGKSKTNLELERGNICSQKIYPIEDVINDADDMVKEILELPKLNDSEKAAIIENINVATKKAIDAIADEQDTDAAINATLKANQAELKQIVKDAVKDNDSTADKSKAKINGATTQASDYIANLPNLTPNEKSAASTALSKIASDAAEQLKKAEDRAAIDKIEADAVKAIDATKEEYKKLSDEKTAYTTFVKEILTDDNGKLITSITEKTIIKILQGEDRWIALSQANKDTINKQLQEAGGKPFETLLEEAKATSKTVSDVGDNYDKGSIPFYVSKTTTTSTTLKWKKVNGADGYFVYTNFCNSNEKKNKPKLVKDVTSGSKTTYKVTKRKKNKWYKYRIVAYKIINGNKTPISQSLLLHECNADKNYKYAGPSKVTVSKKKITLAVNKTAKIKAKLVIPKGKKFKKHSSKFRYIVSDGSIATVDKNGTVTAKSAGTCSIYVCAQNGIYKTVNVTVK